MSIKKVFNNYAEYLKESQSEAKRNQELQIEINNKKNKSEIQDLVFGEETRYFKPHTPLTEDQQVSLVFSGYNLSKEDVDALTKDFTTLSIGLGKLATALGTTGNVPAAGLVGAAASTTTAIAGGLAVYSLSYNTIHTLGSSINNSFENTIDQLNKVLYTEQWKLSLEAKSEIHDMIEGLKIKEKELKKITDTIEKNKKKIEAKQITELEATEDLIKNVEPRTLTGNELIDTFSGLKDIYTVIDKHILNAPWQDDRYITETLGGANLRQTSENPYITNVPQPEPKPKEEPEPETEKTEENGTTMTTEEKNNKIIADTNSKVDPVLKKVQEGYEPLFNDEYKEIIDIEHNISGVLETFTDTDIEELELNLFNYFDIGTRDSSLNSRNEVVMDQIQEILNEIKDNKDSKTKVKKLTTKLRKLASKIKLIEY